MQSATARGLASNSAAGCSASQSGVAQVALSDEPTGCRDGASDENRDWARLAEAGRPQPHAICEVT
eukprot:CAMPEP_0180067180 /NCGR_PEP_ID=MMETSP0985-20121206/9707_1 /TAXON_ID=483367 /ORGANISM="non described non described, Strain CCMP 2436" /LENGTH=65 /DNA_ID=CAMNT_0021997791 /DNA_START=1058 /DNA_END=1252 /DNA_ORIENTATION=+